MIRKLIITALLFIVAFRYSNSQQDSSVYDKYPLKINKAYVKSYFTDSWKIVKSPFYWKNKQWITAAVITGTGILLYTQDDAIHKFVHKKSNDFTDATTKYFLEPIGRGLYTLPLLASMYIYGTASGNNKPKMVALLGVKAFIISSIFGQIVKQVTHRHRPYQNDPPDFRKWDGPFSDIKYTSFPSGHTISAFSIATVLAEAYKDKMWVPIVSYSLATLTGLSRIHDNKHWATDVFAGAVIGYFTGRFVFRSYMNKNNVTIQPVSGNGYSGLSLRWNF